MRVLSVVHYELRRADFDTYSRIPGWRTSFVQAGVVSPVDTLTRTAGAKDGGITLRPKSVGPDPWTIFGWGTSLNSWRTLEGLSDTICESDAILIIEPNTFLAKNCAQVARHFSIPLILRTHAFLSYPHASLPPYLVNQHYVCRQVTLHTPVTKLSEDYFNRLNPWKKKPVVRRIYLGVNTHDLHPRASVPERRLPELGVEFSDENRRRILFVGRLTVEKGLPELVEAYTRLREGRKDLELWIAGQGPCLKLLQPGLRRGTIRYFGVVKPPLLYRLYRAADLLCMPSREQWVFGMPVWLEDFGHSAIEAMASGIPVLVGNSGALPEVVGDPEQCLTTSKVDELVSALSRSLTDRYIQEKGQVNRIRVETFFSAERNGGDVGAAIAAACV
jgi:glycosyltransferase involved in cell wall biosynthesis